MVARIGPKTPVYVDTDLVVFIFADSPMNLLVYIRVGSSLFETTVPTAVSPSPEPAASFWSDLRNSFRGIPHDFTSGSIWRAIVLLAVPMVLKMLTQSLFGVVDVFFVGRLGADAVAAVGITDTLMMLVYTVGSG